MSVHIGCTTRSYIPGRILAEAHFAVLGPHGPDRARGYVLRDNETVRQFKDGYIRNFHRGSTSPAAARTSASWPTPEIACRGQAWPASRPAKEQDTSPLAEDAAEQRVCSPHRHPTSPGGGVVHRFPTCKSAFPGTRRHTCYGGHISP